MSGKKQLAELRSSASSWHVFMFRGGVKKHGFTRPKLNMDSKDDGACILLDMAIEFSEGSYSILDTFLWGATKLDANLFKF